MTKYTLSNAWRFSSSEFYVGIETGALYVKAPTDNRYICVVSAKGSVQAGDWETGGKFEPVRPGVTITIEV